MNGRGICRRGAKAVLVGVLASAKDKKNENQKTDRLV